MGKLEDWLFNEFAGKLVARLAVTIAGYAASTQAQGLLAAAGIHGVVVNPTELTATLIALSHAGYDLAKAKRLAATTPTPQPVAVPAPAVSPPPPAA